MKFFKLQNWQNLAHVSVKYLNKITNIKLIFLSESYLFSPFYTYISVEIYEKSKMKKKKSLHKLDKSFFSFYRENKLRSLAHNASTRLDAHSSVILQTWSVKKFVMISANRNPHLTDYQIHSHMLCGDVGTLTDDILSLPTCIIP